MEKNGYRPIDIAATSIEMFGPDNVKLTMTSCLMKVWGYTSNGSCSWDLQGWVCFASEIDAILYLRYFWFDEILKTKGELKTIEKDIIGVTEKAFKIAISEASFCNRALKSIIRAGICNDFFYGRAGFNECLTISNESCDLLAEISKEIKEIDDTEELMEKYKDFLPFESEQTFSAGNEEHLELLRKWLIAWNQRHNA